jgi:hypothetical protein
MHFHESQKFPLRQAAIALLVPPSIMTLLLVWQVVLNHHWKGQSISNSDMIFWTVFLWLVYLRLTTVRIVTKVSAGKLEVKLRGLFRRRRIPLTDIRNVKTITFDPVRDYGGYGIRSIPGGKAWLADSASGVSLELADGQSLVIGTHKPTELAAALSNNVS